MVEFSNDTYLFTGDCIALEPNEGYNFMCFLCVDYKQNIQSVKRLKARLKDKKLKGIYMAYTGVTCDQAFLFAHIEKNRRILLKRGTYNSEAPHDLYSKIK